MRLAAALTFFTISVPSFLTVFARHPRLDGRPHANITPHPAIQRVSLPDGASGIRNGTVLPPYSTIYYFDQVRPVETNKRSVLLTHQIAHRS
jgi:hypothetical protein